MVEGWMQSMHVADCVYIRHTASLNHQPNAPPPWHPIMRRCRGFAAAKISGETGKNTSMLSPLFGSLYFRRLSVHRLP